MVLCICSRTLVYVSYVYSTASEQENQPGLIVPHTAAPWGKMDASVISGRELEAEYAVDNLARGCSADSGISGLQIQRSLESDNERRKVRGQNESWCMGLDATTMRTGWHFDLLHTT